MLHDVQIKPQICSLCSRLSSSYRCRAPVGQLTRSANRDPLPPTQTHRRLYDSGSSILRLRSCIADAFYFLAVQVLVQLLLDLPVFMTEKEIWPPSEERRYSRAGIWRSNVKYWGTNRTYAAPYSRPLTPEASLCLERRLWTHFGDKLFQHLNFKLSHCCVLTLTPAAEADSMAAVQRVRRKYLSLGCRYVTDLPPRLHCLS